MVKVKKFGEKTVAKDIGEKNFGEC